MRNHDGRDGTGGHLLDEPHHDPSPAYCADASPALGDEVPVRVRVPHAHRARQVVLRTVRDGEPLVRTARVESEDEDATWWTVDVPVHNPVAGYRFLLDGADGSYAWLNGSGRHRRDVTDADDYRLLADAAPAPDWVPDTVLYQVFPDRFARAGGDHGGLPRAERVPEWAVPCRWDDEVLAHGPLVARQWFGGDLGGVAEHLDHLTDLGATALYLTPVFEAGSTHRYDALGFDRVDPLLGGDAALAALTAAAHRRGLRVLANMTGRLGPDDRAHAVARGVRAAMVSEDPEGWLLAEHGHDATGDLAAGGWHGTMSYAGFTRPV